MSTSIAPENNKLYSSGLKEYSTECSTEEYSRCSLFDVNDSKHRASITSHPFKQKL